MSDPAGRAAADAVRAPAPREHHLTVPRSARYVVLGEPGPHVRTLWIALHGYGQLAARFARRCAPLAGDHALVAVPEALSRFYLDAPAGGSHAAARVGASWMTREDRLAEIGDHVAYLDLLVARLREECGGAPAVRALGFSQGVATMARWLAFGATRVERAVAWGGLLPEDLDLAQLADRLEGAPFAFVIGEADGHRSVEQVRAQAAAARERGVASRVVTYAGGHALDAETLAAVAAA